MDVYIQDLEGRLLYVTPKGAATLGYQPNQMIGRTWRELAAAPADLDTLDAQREAAIRTGEPQAFSGQAHDEYRFTPLRNAEGRLIAIAAHVRVKRDDGSVTGDTRLAQEILAAISDVVYAYDLQQRVTYWNEAAAQFYGVAQEEALDQVVTTIYDRMWLLPDDQETLTATFANTGYVQGRNIHILRSGEERIVEFSASQVVNPETGESNTLIVLRDKTGEHRMANALRDSEAQFRTLAQAVGAAVFIYQGTGYVFVNDAALAITGYSREDFSYLTFWDIAHPDERELTQQRGIARQRGENMPDRVVYRIIAKNGQTRWLDTNMQTIIYNGAVAGLGTGIDITERIEAENALRESEERYRALSDSAFEGLVINNGTHSILANHKVVELFGYDSMEIFLRTPLQELITPESLVVVRQVVANADSAAYEVVGRKQDGQTFPLEVQSRPILYQGKPMRVVAVRDISARKQIEAALHARDVQLHTIIDNAPVILVALDTTGRITLLDGRGLATLGMETATWIGQSVYELFADIPNIPDMVRRTLAGNHINDRVELGDRIFDVSTVPLRNGDVAPIGVSVVGIDITDRVQAEKSLHQTEEQLRQSQKMEALGRLAGGVAHDFNNLLTAILGYGELTKSYMGNDTQVTAFVNEMIIAAERAAALTRQLLTFSRKQPRQPRSVDLNHIVAGVQSMLTRVVGETIVLSIVLPPAVAAILADPHEIEQILMNMVVNAHDAMPEGGTIELAVTREHVDPIQAARQPGASAGIYQVLHIRDIGIGMDAATLDHIFEPFFTTKEVGKGTGLGLATVYGIVQQSDGFISVESTVGRGTTFRIYFPAQEADTIPQHITATPQIIGGSETVLLIEDEPGIRRVVTKVLQDFGYQVIAAENGLSALAIVENLPEIPALVVTDVVMPKMGGFRVSRLLRERRPQLRILYMSGYTDPEGTETPLSDKWTEIISKPFSMEILARSVRRLLDTP